MTANSKALQDVLAERERQDLKWGVQNHEHLRWLAILGEEVGETNSAVLESNAMQYRTEMVEVAAVALAAVECFDRRAETWGAAVERADA